jgi:hypothetical protein
MAYHAEAAIVLFLVFFASLGALLAGAYFLEASLDESASAGHEPPVDQPGLTASSRALEHVNARLPQDLVDTPTPVGRAAV